MQQYDASVLKGFGYFVPGMVSGIGPDQNVGGSTSI